MTIACAPLNFVGMAKSKDKTRPVGYRLAESLLTRLDEFCERHTLHPTATQVVDAALREYLDAHERELPPAAKPKGK